MAASTDRMHSDEAEISVLGAMMLDGAAATEAAALLSPDDFAHLPHQHIFGAISALRDQGHAPDVMSVREELRRRGQLEEAGGSAYLARIVEIVPTAANLTYHARTVRQYSTRRALVDFAGWLSHSARNGHSTEDLFDEAERRVLSITGRGAVQDGTRLAELLDPAIEFGRSMPEKAISSGLRDLDALTGGLRPTELTLIGARPSQGKTALGVQVAYEAAKRGRSVAFVSLEMAEGPLALRFLACAGKIDLRRLLGAGSLSEDEREALGAARRILTGLPITIATTPRRITEIRSFARRQAIGAGLDLLVVDYLQLVSGSGENRTQEIGSISRGLKRLAIELEVPILALAQLSRGAERHGSGRPRLSDLRESGDLEADADCVWLLYRPDFEMTETEARNVGAAGKAEIILAKHRNGPTGICTLFFDKPSATFGLWERGRR